MPASADRLRTIKNFDGLIRYLEDELEWPLQGYDIEDLTFDWTDDLGLKEEDLIKKVRVYQLRPLEHGQSWGIFFIEFEKKKLPVVVLRRILSRLVVKKRAAANKAKSAAYDAHDILFISAFGNEASDQREIAFAHFHQESGDLPTLRVLGWDGGDTPLKLDYVEATLKSKLRWPDDPADHAAWREQWSRAFRHRIGHVIRTADELAEKLAELARGIRDAAQTMIRHESERGQLRRLYRAFQTALIHDLSEEDFADTYAQTITYGLLTAAISRTDVNKGSYTETLIAEDVVSLVPVTSPFLKEMLQKFLKLGGRKGGIDFDELGIQDVVDLLRDNDKTDLPAILRDFGNKSRGEDPVIHFYEHFLAAYNKKLKVQRGVFYTPQPVVSYIARSVHELLQTEFGLEVGLADTTTWEEFVAREQRLNPKSDIRIPEGVAPDLPFVQILDPAVGTATFLVEVIDVIHRTLTDKWTKQGLKEAERRTAWNEYVPKHLLPRLHGYELMMAPYAIAHMKLPLKLKETGFTAWGKLGDNDRARIYLTNALEPPSDEKKQMEFAEWAPALAYEAAAVNEIKRHKRFTVVIGNPPYANYSANLSPQARRIVDKYRNFRGVPIRERNQLQFERNIQDDFVKFISIAQDIIGATGVGVFSYITNGTMLASTSLRGMRENLAQEFSNLFELNLHGGVNEIIVGVEDDENVFDIAQSVAIHVYVLSKSEGTSEVRYADLLGRRSSKYATLTSRSVTSTEWQYIQPDRENFAFTPQDEAVGETMHRLESIFVKFGAGIKTNRDALVIGFDEISLLESVRKLNDRLASGKGAQRHIHSLLYRPFDVRLIFYHEDTVASRSLPTMKHVVAGPNIGFVSTSTWTTPDRFSVGISRLMVEMKTGTHDRGTTFFPLYRYESLLGEKAEQVHNFTQEFVKEWCTSTQTQFVPIGRGDGERTTGPEDILFWLYGLFHSPEYRRRYRVTLSQRFPIVLLTSNLEMFRMLAQIGSKLVALHLVEFALKGEANAPAEWLRYPRLALFTGADRTVSDKFPAADKAWKDGRVVINASSGFEGVPEEVWSFHIGGYQVCHKWLKDRKGRILTDEDILHYCKIVTALNETIRLMRRIDEVINEHGGWPGAFASTSETKQESQLPFE